MFMSILRWEAPVQSVLLWCHGNKPLPHPPG